MNKEVYTLPEPDDRGIIHLEPHTEYVLKVPRTKEVDEAWDKLKKEGSK